MTRSGTWALLAHLGRSIQRSFATAPESEITADPGRTGGVLLSDADHTTPEVEVPDDCNSAEAVFASIRDVAKLRGEAALRAKSPTTARWSMTSRKCTDDQPAVARSSNAASRSNCTSQKRIVISRYIAIAVLT